MEINETNIRNEVIQKEISLPESVYGYLDWKTGVIRLNIKAEDYVNYDNMPAYFKDEFNETLIHELFHSIQICTCGFLYNYVNNITADFWIEFIDDKSKFNDLLSNKETSISKGLNSKLLLLEKKDVINGLTIIDIIESHAFFTHNFITHPTITSYEYNIKMELYNDTIYSNAYHFLKKCIGDKAFYALYAISYVSLCFGNPTQVFEAISKGLIKYKDDISFSNIEKLLDKVIPSSVQKNELDKYLGIPLKLIHHNKPIQPFYEHTIKLINKKYSINEIRSIMADPTKLSDLFKTVNLRPIMFNTTEVIIPKNYKNDIFKETNSLEEAFVYFTYLSFKALNSSKSGPYYLKL